MVAESWKFAHDPYSSRSTTLLSWFFCRREKRKEQMPHGLNKKRHAKKNQEKQKYIKKIGRCCCWTCSGRARTWEKLDLKKKIETEKNWENDWKSCITPHKWLIGMVASRPARPATATAAATTPTLGGHVWLGHPYVCMSVHDFLPNYWR